jgi:hypothetical protein
MDNLRSREEVENKKKKMGETRTTKAQRRRLEKLGHKSLVQNILERRVMVVVSKHHHNIFHCNETSI